MLVSCPLKWGMAHPLKRALFHMLPCQIWSFSTSKGVGISRKYPKNWGALRPRPLRMDGSMADPLKTRHSPRVSYRIWTFLVKTCALVVWSQKFILGYDRSAKPLKNTLLPVRFTTPNLGHT